MLVTLCTRHSISAPIILLSTQETDARDAFLRMAREHHPSWRVLVLGAATPHNKIMIKHHYYSELQTRALHDTWLQSLSSVLVLLNAPHIVLARGSNWARLIDDLRRTRINALCDGCTSVIDLNPPGSVGDRRRAQELP